MTRPSIDNIMMRTALLMSERATCSRLSVGCVITDHRGKLVSSGWNGAPAGESHCPPIELHQEACTNAVHSERNAIEYGPAELHWGRGESEPFTMYCTHSPCLRCAMLMLDTGIARVVFSSTYRDTSPLDMLTGAGVTVLQY